MQKSDSLSNGQIDFINSLSSLRLYGGFRESGTSEPSLSKVEEVVRMCKLWMDENQHKDVTFLMTPDDYDCYAKIMCGSRQKAPKDFRVKQYGRKKSF